MSNTVKTPIIILGGGPAGLMVAIELGRRGVNAILVEEQIAPPSFPKANATTSRSMEHYRRLGFAKAIRECALPAGYPDDITYLTRYTGFELARLSGKTLKNTNWQASHKSRWPTAEPLARVQQMDVESVMRKELAKHSSIEVMFGWRAIAIDFSVSPTLVKIDKVDDDQTLLIEADYVVGADGPRSLVRKNLQISYEGNKDLDRDFFGGYMLATYFRSSEFNKAIGHESWQYWAVNKEQRGLLCALREENTFVHHVQLAAGQEISLKLAQQSLERAMGCAFNYEVIDFGAWTAGFALVAEHMADSPQHPKAFLVGDAAHLFTPSGGQGYNTAVDDAVNLGWKLAAVCQGWGGSELLNSYASERRPIAKRNTQFARAMAESIGRIKIPDGIEDSTPEGEQKRQLLGRALAEHSAKEFDIPGITYGINYAGSAVVCSDDAPAPNDLWNDYTPTTVPGCRAPHIWLEEKTAIHDLFGKDFTLLRFGGAQANEASLIQDAMRDGVQLSVLDIDNEQARELYQCDRVLVRPDHHVAWRANELPTNFTGILRRVSGHIDRTA